jgi:hypothetical protein
VALEEGWVEVLGSRGPGAPEQESTGFREEKLK